MAFALLVVLGGRWKEWKKRAEVVKREDSAAAHAQRSAAAAFEAGVYREAKARPVASSRAADSERACERAPLTILPSFRPFW